MAVSMTRKILSLCIALIPLAQIAAAAPTLGAGEEAWVNGTVKKIDLKTRTCIVTLESLRRIDGTPAPLPSKTDKAVTIPQTVRISHLNSPQRWILLADLPLNAPVALTVIGAEDPRLPWQGRSLLVHRPDPLVPPFTAPDPLGLNPVETDKVTLEPITVPMIFPVAGPARWSDTFLAARGGGTRRHRGQDLFGPKMTPLLACFDGVVSLALGQGNAGHSLTIKGDNGWTAQYYHLNNDTPGTDDGRASYEYIFGPGIANGTRVRAGQIIGYLGDSGNAEGTTPHLHFELWHQATNACFNPVASLQTAIPLKDPLLYVPFPEISAGEKMVRLDGHVRVVDPVQNLVVLDLVAERQGEGPLQTKLKPETRTVRAPVSPRFLLLESGEVVSPADLPLHAQVAVFAEAAPQDGAHNLARAWVLPGAPAPANRANPPVANAQKSAEKSRPALATSSISFATETVVITKSFARRSNTHHADQLAAALNQSRETQGLVPLKVDPALCDAALAHSIAMRDGDFFDELDLKSNRTPTDLAAHRGYKGHVRALVLASRTPERLAPDLQSKAADTLRDPNLRTLGVGYVYQEYDPGQTNVRHYYTILLGT